MRLPVQNKRHSFGVLSTLANYPLLSIALTPAHWQTNNSEALRFKRAAFYNGLKSKVGLAAAKAAALRINLKVCHTSRLIM